jgi:hypothetical protein
MNPRRVIAIDLNARNWRVWNCVAAFASWLTASFGTDRPHPSRAPAGSTGGADRASRRKSFWVPSGGRLDRECGQIRAVLPAVPHARLPLVHLAPHRASLRAGRARSEVLRRGGQLAGGSCSASFRGFGPAGRPAFSSTSKGASAIGSAAGHASPRSIRPIRTCNGS